MKHPRTHVSDHALLRYLERVQGFDVEALRRQIGHAVDRAAGLGASGVQLGGFVFKLASDGAVPVVVTVRRVGAPNIRAGHKPRRRGGP